MAGPCSIESEEQIVAFAKAVKASVATMLRGRASSRVPRPIRSGYGEGLALLKLAREKRACPS
jgi:3-deoxy-7-phosphoheptulonate synthase